MKLSRKNHILILSVIGVVYFFGVAAVIYPMLGNIYTMSSSGSVIRSYEESVGQMPEAEKDDRLINAIKYNQDIANGIYGDGLEGSLCDENGIMCYVDIPKLDIYIPVYSGAQPSALEKGCGWVMNTSLPVGGESTHCVISAHTGIPTAKMFSQLDRSELGDMFYIHVLDMVLAYNVDSIVTVLPEETEYLEIIDGEDHCTLLTCTPYGINDHRLLVRGVRVDDSAPSVSSEEGASGALVSRDSAGVKEDMQGQIIRSIVLIVVIVVAAVVIFAGFCIWLSMPLKKKAPARPSARENGHGDTDKE